MTTRAKANRQASGATVSNDNPNTHKRHETSDTAMDVDDDDAKGGVDAKRRPFNGRKKSRGAVGKKKADQLQSVDCICSKGDDGSPMILCTMCKIWYHFTCVEITEPQAEEINVYICPTCNQTTGRNSAMYWEGQQAIEECTDEDDATVVKRRAAVLKTQPALPGAKRGQAQLDEPPKLDAEESDEADDSEDDYVEENGAHKRRHSRLLRLSTATESSDEDVGDQATKRRRVRRLGSPPQSPSVHGSKRKASMSKAVSPSSKRKRSATSGSIGDQDDPVRKYCLSKLEDVFKEIYLRNPFVRLKEEEDSGEGENGFKIVKKELADMNDEEKDALVEHSKQFARELESCVYEIYAEPDKNGSPHAGAKYKDRFRTLQFNLSKPDRVVIHQRILSGSLSAKEISVMSSTDLADEETKLSIRQAEKEALEHSILQKQMAPRAKITHKGLQDIEDVRGENIGSQDFELEKERQEEKREREKLARLKTTRQRTASVSVPPESPVVPTSATSFDGHQEQWGAPPPVPFHAMASPTVEDSASGQRPGLYVQTTSDFTNSIPEAELNLGDIIHIDEDQDTKGAHIGESSTSMIYAPNVMGSPTEMSHTPLSLSTTGISPFAQRQEPPRTPSFDLNALWSQQSLPPLPPPQPPTTATTITHEDDLHQLKPGPMEDKAKSGAAAVDEGDNMELESIEANDQDFDMFLADDTEVAPQPPPLPEPTPPLSADNLPQVWTGKILMPLDTGVVQEANLVARQIGGKPLPPDSLLWKTLFPSDSLKVEGRVPVENAIKYLVQMRLNPSKELYAALFAPSGSRDENDFKMINEFLINKRRHGLVFPWRNTPKEYQPGRELYVIPLLQTHVLPEFVELLDDLKLPKVRSKDYIIGVWILNKGKLTPPPGQAPHPPPVVQPPSAMLLHQQPGNLPMLPQISNPADIHNLLRTLASTTQAAPLPGQPPFVLHGIPPPVPPQPWNPQAAQPPLPPFPFNFPPPNVPFQPQPVHNSPNSPTRYDHRGGPDRKEYDGSGGGGYERDYRSGPSHHHDHGDRNNYRGGGGGGGGGERGWRGPSRGRGRGRGRGDGYQDRDFRPQRDSGWPRRPKNDGQDGPSW